MKFNEIQPYTKSAGYSVDVSISYLQTQTELFADWGCNFDPDFQRPHVWTEKQQQLFVEHILKGGKTGRDIFFNCPGWNSVATNNQKDFVLVDGKQRLEAFRKFLANELRVFGHLYSEFEGRVNVCIGLKFHVNDLKTRAEVLQWYLDFNTGGTVHTDQEIKRVKALLEIAKKT